MSRVTGADESILPYALAAARRLCETTDFPALSSVSSILILLISEAFQGPCVDEIETRPLGGKQRLRLAPDP